MLDFLAAAEYDGVILDIMMPKLDGLAVLKQLRQEGKTTPVLFLTARDSVADKVKGLDLGANDYLVKPFSFEELLARIRAMTRQTVGLANNVLTVGDLTLDCGSHLVKRGERQLNLSLTMKAAPMWWMCISAICAKRWMKESRSS